MPKSRMSRAMTTLITQEKSTIPTRAGPFFLFFKIMTAHDDELLSLHKYYVKEYYICVRLEKKTIYPTCYTLTKGQRVHLFIDVIFQLNAERLVFIMYHRKRERGSYHRAFWFHSCDRASRTTPRWPAQPAFRQPNGIEQLELKGRPFFFLFF